MTTSEKVAYLKGLAEGGGMDLASQEGKLFSVVLDILENLALDVENLSRQTKDLEEDLESVSENMADLKDLFLGDEEDWEENSEEPVFYRVKCPACGKTITFAESTLAQNSIQCPACGELLDFQIEPDYPEDDEE